MATSARRRQLRELYGFDFPDDLFRFWEFATRLRPLEPLRALEAIEVHLVGPFEVLAGRFDGLAPRYSQLLHWRYHDDPPEFFTVLSGGSDGLHWGLFLDEPENDPGCVASYYARATYEISADGDTLFDAVRLDLERHCRDCVELCLDDPANAAEYEARLGEIDILRRGLTRYATGERTEQGADYEERFPPQVQRDLRVVAATREGMGVAAPGDTYRPLRLKDPALWRQLRQTDDPAHFVEEARQALQDGYPATALKLGKDLWAIGGPRRTEYAYELLDAAYAALRRPTLREVLRVHQAQRDLPSVDILDSS